MSDIKNILFPDSSILLVEDEPALMLYMKTVLSKICGHINLAENGLIGLELFSTINPDIVITDISMPVMDGLTMSSKIREINPNAHIVIITALDDTESLIKTINIGVNQFLLKPVEKKHLEAAAIKALKIINLDKELSKKNSIIHVLSTAIEQSPLMILIMTTEGKTEYVNPAFCDLFGLKPEDFINKERDIFEKVNFNKFDLKGFHELLDKSNPNWNGELCINKPNGEKTWIQANVSPIRNTDGNITHIIKILKDISEMKNYEKQLEMINDNLESRVKQRTIELETLNRNLNSEIEARYIVEESLRKAKEEAESANKMKSLFLAKVSHELRTPLNGIIGVSSILQETNLDEKQIKFIKMLKLSGENLLKIINDILEVSKIENGKMKLIPVQFKIRDLIEQTIDIISVTANEKKLDILCEIDPNIPDNLIGDSVKLNQILMNLLNNSIKFTKKGSINIQIKLISKINTQIELYFSIEDTGIGIPDNKLDLLFKSFSQVDNSLTRKYGGIGLGLSITKEFVEMMGGKISVETKVNQGTKFAFLVKLNESFINDNVTKSKSYDELPLKIIADNYPDTNLSILVAEDSRIMQEFIKNGLSMKNWDITVVSNGLEALEAYKSKYFDIIIMDMLMPEMNGYESANLIRQMEKGNKITPIIGLTGDDNNELSNELLNCMDIVVTKPFKWDDLFSSIFSLITPKKFINYSDFKININTLLMNLNNNKNLFKKISTYFIENYTFELNKLKSFIDNNDYDNAKQISHKLKSEVGNFGAVEAVDLAREIELMSKNRNFTEALVIYYLLEEKMNYLCDNLKNFLILDNY